MNDLSLLLYFAEVLNNVGIAITVLSLVGGIAAVGVMIPSAVTMQGNRKYNTQDHLDDDYSSARAWFQRSSRWSIVALCAFVLAMFLPSKQTVYLIAASEVGEETIQTPEFKKVRQLLNEYLDEQLEGETK